MFLSDDSGLAFDDILLKPGYSEIDSRNSVDISTSLAGFKFEIPLISSPMDTVTEWDMASVMAIMGGLGIIHRGMGINTQAGQVRQAIDDAKYQGVNFPIVGAAIGIKRHDIDRADALIQAGASIICIDVSHAHHRNVALQIKTFRSVFKDFPLIVGNVATDSGAHFLAEHGVDAIRVGIGNGSICSTRLNCGHGVPQVSALLEINKTLNSCNPRPEIISDGGCKNPGDIVKALACGADMVMLGSMLGSTRNAPGDVSFSDELACYVKEYRGMASKDAQIEWAESVSSIEGITSLVPITGYTATVIREIVQNIKAGLSYSGAPDLATFRRVASANIISPSSIEEGRTHILNRGLKV